MSDTDPGPHFRLQTWERFVHRAVECHPKVMPSCGRPAGPWSKISCFRGNRPRHRFDIGTAGILPHILMRFFTVGDARQATVLSGSRRNGVLSNRFLYVASSSWGSVQSRSFQGDPASGPLRKSYRRDQHGTPRLTLENQHSGIVLTCAVYFRQWLSLRFSRSFGLTLAGRIHRERQSRSSMQELFAREGV